MPWASNEKTGKGQGPNQPVWVINPWVTEGQLMSGLLLFRQGRFCLRVHQPLAACFPHLWGVCFEGACPPCLKAVWESGKFTSYQRVRDWWCKELLFPGEVNFNKYQEMTRIVQFEIFNYREYWVAWSLLAMPEILPFWILPTPCFVWLTLNKSLSLLDV